MRSPHYRKMLATCDDAEIERYCWHNGNIPRGVAPQQNKRNQDQRKRQDYDGK